VSAGSVSKRYATALFELARDASERDKGVLDAVAADMQCIERELESGAARELLDRRTGVERGSQLLESLTDKMHVLTSNLVRLLAKRRRLEVLRDLPAAFHRCLLADRGQVEGVVESARPLGGGELAEIAVAVGSLLGKEVILKGRVDPSLIAGVRVLVDNRLIDQSAVGRLEGLRRKLAVAQLG